MSSHRHRRLCRLITAGLVAGVLVAPPALAMPMSGGSAADPDTPVDASATLAASEPLVMEVEPGFDWGAAAIGAGGGAALLALGLGGVASTSRARVRVLR